MSNPNTVGVTVGESTGGAVTVYVDGEQHSVPNPGMTYAPGMSVALQRLGQGRYQIIGLAGHWAPQP